MIKRKLRFGASFVFALVLAQLASEFSRANDLTTSVGYYSQGSIREASALPLQGTGFVKIFANRARYYGSAEITSLIVDSAKELQKRFPSPDRIQIADLSAQKGGFIGGHVSHQNGLDADIAFIRLNQTEQPPRFDQTKNHGFQEVFVKNGKISENFDALRNWELIRILFESGKVQRIFMDQEIKQSLCRHLKATNQLLHYKNIVSRIRIESDHTAHMHVRLYCPKGNSECKAQPDRVFDLGCM